MRPALPGKVQDQRRPGGPAPAFGQPHGRCPVGSSWFRACGHASPHGPRRWIVPGSTRPSPGRAPRGSHLVKRTEHPGPVGCRQGGGRQGPPDARSAHTQSLPHEILCCSGAMWDRPIRISIRSYMPQQTKAVIFVLPKSWVGSIKIASLPTPTPPPRWRGDVGDDVADHTRVRPSSPGTATKRRRRRGEHQSRPRTRRHRRQSGIGAWPRCR